VLYHCIGCDVNFDRFGLPACSIKQQPMACVKPIECATNKATTEALLIGHETLWSKRPFDCIAQGERNRLI
tara:strand:- start:702 stop:914 length:213 start_codon:yes stop_codon:yes gene_type:complete